MKNIDYTRCLHCKENKSDCKCEGGYKIIFLYGKPVSKEEIDAHLNKSKSEQILDATTFISGAIDKNMDKIIKESQEIRETSKDLVEILETKIDEK